MSTALGNSDLEALQQLQIAQGRNGAGRLEIEKKTLHTYNLSVASELALISFQKMTVNITKVQS
jgi:hypothetical protein